MIHYDKEKKNNVDFLIKNSLSGEIIPVEVGFNKKYFQIKDAIKRFDSKYGIMVTNVEKTELTKDILTIPITTFLFC